MNSDHQIDINYENNEIKYHNNTKYNLIQLNMWNLSNYVMIVFFLLSSYVQVIYNIYKY